MSVAIALAVATVVQMIFGELIPKAIATTRPLETSLAMARPTQLYGVVARPLVALLDGMAARLTRASGSSRPRSSRWFPTAENSST